MISNLFTEILNFIVYIIITHPLIIANQVHKIAIGLCVIVVWLRVIAVEVNHNYIRLFPTAILSLKLICWLGLIILLNFLFLLDFLFNNLHLRITIT